MNANLYHTLSQHFSDHLAKTCLQLPDGRSWSYGELDNLSARLSGLMLKTANPGDRILMQTEKSPEAVALYLACLRSGLVLVPLNTAYTSAELAYFTEDAQPALIVSDTVLADLCAQAASSRPRHEIAISQGSDMAAILYTSGTTGRSKGAVLSHDNLASNALALHKLWGFEQGDVLLHALPIFHVHGLFIALNTALLNASKILFLERFDANAVIDQLAGATIMMGVPTFYSRLLAHPKFDRSRFRNMRAFFAGSAPLTEQTFAAFEASTGHRIVERYGMSETGVITSNPLQGERVAGTVGYALPGVEVRICDDEGKLLPSGEVGIVETRGPNVFAGYWQMPEKTASEFREDGWFITGDMGLLSIDGRLSLVGREKDLIISGGYNVYPKEVELCLDELPGIAESAVIGVPHPDFGEAVVAICVGSADNLPSTDEVGELLADQLARFKQPKRLIQIDELPRNTMGKVQKNTLREQFQKLFAE